jgi:hypothetical protein
MKAVIVYESMFGNTRMIAESIARGLAQIAAVQTICVTESDTRLPEKTDLLVVGGPTQAWSMSRPNTRRSASGYANKPKYRLTLEPGADTAIGVREWLAAQTELPITAAAFDTRAKGPSALTGRAARAIAKALTRHGARISIPPESFLVNYKSHLVPGEQARAEAWGRRLASAVGAKAGPSESKGLTPPPNPD